MKSISKVPGNERKRCPFIYKHLSCEGSWTLQNAYPKTKRKAKKIEGNLRNCRESSETSAGMVVDKVWRT